MMTEDERPETGAHRVEVWEVDVLLVRTSDVEVRVIAARCNHFAGPLERGESDTVVCPWHYPLSGLHSGEPLEEPAVFPQARYETRARDGNVEIRVVAGNAREESR